MHSPPEISAVACISIVIGCKELVADLARSQSQSPKRRTRFQAVLCNSQLAFTSAAAARVQLRHQAPHPRPRVGVSTTLSWPSSGFLHTALHFATDECTWSCTLETGTHGDAAPRA